MFSSGVKHGLSVNGNGINGIDDNGCGVWEGNISLNGNDKSSISVGNKKSNNNGIGSCGNINTKSNTISGGAINISNINITNYLLRCIK
jgi:hypothetical protein